MHLKCAMMCKGEIPHERMMGYAYRGFSGTIDTVYRYGTRRVMRIFLERKDESACAKGTDGIRGWRHGGGIHMELAASSDG